jgi:hypothetical protein
MTWTILKDVERYFDNDESPRKIEVHGTIQQARWVAEQLSYAYAGCSYMFYVKEDPESK